MVWQRVRQLKKYGLIPPFRRTRWIQRAKPVAERVAERLSIPPPDEPTCLAQIGLSLGARNQFASAGHTAPHEPGVVPLAQHREY